MIELIDFSKSYSKKNAPTVQNINISAGKGITTLLGLNGAGKTTIIKAILGLHYSTTGIVKVSDENNIFFDAAINPDKVRSLIGYVSESDVLPKNLTICEYLKFIQKIYSRNSDNKNQFSDLFEQTIQTWNLSGVLDKRIGQLSKGFKQRVSFAQCFIHNPTNIVLDEPINGLDPAQIIQFRKFLKKISETKTVLISTHLMQEVHSICSNIYIISNGKIAIKGTESEIINQTNTNNIEEAFLNITGSSCNE